MKLRLLGSGGYHPSRWRHTACLLLPEVGIVLDAGTGMFRLPAYVRTRTVDVFLTHAHLDHVVGLTYLLGMLGRKELEQVRVFGAAVKLEAIRRHLFAPDLFPVVPEIVWCPLDGPQPLPGDGVLTYFPLEHPGGALGFRLDWPGHRLAYVTDTRAGPEVAYEGRLRGVDLLVHECYFGDESQDLAELTGHSCVGDVARLAARADVGQLLLVHLDPSAAELDPIDVRQARQIFPTTCLGRDEMELEF